MRIARRVLVAATVSLCACNVNVRAVDDQEYRDTWREGMTEFIEVGDQFRSGICNVPIDQERCHAASAESIEVIDRFLVALETTEVPEDFAEGDDAVRAAFRDLREGLAQRNRGFETDSDADFRAGNERMGLGAQELAEAYELFPAGFRPEPAP